MKLFKLLKSSITFTSKQLEKLEHLLTDLLWLL